ncbi:hypothetical protein M0R19_04810 [Candidatus Pacearchaeota archaeon]|jgi:hypothetical protein|nr:hypothetical protein [Candidatus Pacearchaeota archaeon]
MSDITDKEWKEFLIKMCLAYKIQNYVSPHISKLEERFNSFCYKIEEGLKD